MIHWEDLRQISSFEGEADCVIVAQLKRRRDGRWHTVRWHCANWTDDGEEDESMPEGAAASLAGELVQHAMMCRAGSVASNAALNALNQIASLMLARGKRE